MRNFTGCSADSVASLTLSSDLGEGWAAQGGEGAGP